MVDYKLFLMMMMTTMYLMCEYTVSEKKTVNISVYCMLIKLLESLLQTDNYSIMNNVEHLCLTR